jgi:cytochrome c
MLLLGFSWSVHSQNPDKLISGPGSTLTENKCKICHELQHIRRAPLSRGEWADNLRNMKERGTPMDEAEIAVILDYLAAYYNREKPAPAPAPDTLATGGGDPMQKLLNAHACNGCHAVDRKVVGPSFRDVAAKYSPNSMNQLVKKIREGSQGAWGPVPMPPNAGVSEADAKSLVGWILGRK